MGIPLGATLNVGLQTATLVLLLLGLRYGVRTHRALQKGMESASVAEGIHMNLMTSAVAVSGVGLLVWMLPNFLLGWGYGTNLLGYGTGGYQSYLESSGVALPHAFLLILHILLGGIVAVLGALLVVRMRWGRVPRAPSIGIYRLVMVATWAMWFTNILVGYAIFYYFAILGTG